MTHFNGLSQLALAAIAPRPLDTASLSSPILYTIKIPKARPPLPPKIEAVFPTYNARPLDRRHDGSSGRRGSIASKIMPGAWKTSRPKHPTARPSKWSTPTKNRWRIETGGKPKVIVNYRLICKQSSVTTNYVGESLGVFNGAATFITLVEQARRPHEVRFELPAAWKRSLTALEPAGDGLPDHYRAEDYDALVDSPILAGNPSIHDFAVDGSKHVLVDIGELGAWDGAAAAGDIEKLVVENRRLWGFLPFKKYVFLNVFRQGGGGLEHKNSTLLTARRADRHILPTTSAGSRSSATSTSTRSMSSASGPSSSDLSTTSTRPAPAASGSPRASPATTAS